MNANRLHWGPTVRVVTATVVPQPRLWRSAALSMRRLARPGWWRRPPFLPVPDEAYWRFRMETAYGGEGGATVPSAHDVETYLRWCHSQRGPKG